MTTETILTVQHLKKSFRRGRKQVLSDVNLTAFRGECIGILGANGCGKSTLLSILAGIQKPDSGSIQIAVPQAHPIGYVPQECPLMEELNALDNLKLWYCNSPLSLSEELANGFLAMLGIPDFLTTPVKNMSGGMKKRLSIGCAIAQKPEILLLDEPGAALDLICKERIEVYLKNFKKQGNTILLATHEEREIALCDRLFLLTNGELHAFTYNGNIHQLAGILARECTGTLDKK
jgi:ABC-2 type transport system ATP-binding protein